VIGVQVALAVLSWAVTWAVAYTLGKDAGRRER
jgi:hypothetical protein